MFMSVLYQPLATIASRYWHLKTHKRSTNRFEVWMYTPQCGAVTCQGLIFIVTKPSMFNGKSDDEHNYLTNEKRKIHNHIVGASKCWRWWWLAPGFRRQVSFILLPFWASTAAICTCSSITRAVSFVITLTLIKRENCHRHWPVEPPNYALQEWQQHLTSTAG